MAKNWGSVVGALLGGVLLAIIVTVVHQVWFPWLVVGGVAIVGLYVTGLRLSNDSRWPSSAGAIGVLGGVFLLAQRSPGGSVLIPANDAALVWVYGSAIICALVVLWPNVSFRARQ
ncbi:MAG: hypothetical protein RL431_354 [Actinomycetota bacterium]